MNTNEVQPEEQANQEGNGTGTEEMQEQTAAVHEEGEHHDELHPAEDFSSLSREELFAKLNDLANQTDLDPTRGSVQKLKELFREHTKEELEKKRREWEAAKEDEHDVFMPSPDTLSDKFEDVLRKYNQKRAEQKRLKEVETRNNLRRKIELLDELKALAESSESMNKAFEKLQDLQARWREIGPVPSANANELRNNWQHHLDRFFDVVKISRELRDLDHKKNHDLKEELIAKAEALANEPSVRKSLDSLRVLHEQWKEIGPAGKEVNEQLWEKFKAASDAVHVRKQALLEDAKEKQEENLKLKTALVARMDEEAAKTYKSHREWQEAGKVVEGLFEEWRKIGHVPKEDEDKTWKHFRDSRLKFFKSRESYYGQQRETHKKHIDDKMALIARAEAMKDSTDWKNTPQKFKQLQEEWKKTGPVPKKQGDKLWERFRGAADAFFQNKNKHFADQDATYKANSDAREAFINEQKSVVLPQDLNEAKNVMAEQQKKWSELPYAARTDKDRLDKEWKAVQDAMLAQLKERGGDETTLQRMRYDQLKGSDKGREQLQRERMNIQDKIKRLTGEINTLETNLGFFGKSKGAQALVADYQQKVDKARAEIDRLKAQLKQIPRE
jgi:hypothetical protein